ncbi:TlpA disulfide reductase family protein [Luteibacter sp. dw_328]|uniref:TlpA family protein disulfide reductase n=1 Tax=Luteibacter sp. dw_328 TaxID=2719796 RepID=UPI001BD35EB6|nr:TlpA disulfide reductase family protein [Luteibacter sp. dw_328]
MQKIGVLFLLAMLATGTVVADSRPKAFPDEATLRQRLSIDPHSKLVLRGRDGSPIGIKAFLAGANAPGGEFSFIPDPGSGIVTLTLSKLPSKPLNKWGDLVIGDPLPAFTLPSSEGRTIRSHRFDHDLTVVNFFFYECTGCIAEIPALNAFHAAHPEIGALGLTYEAKEGLAAFRKKYGMQWEIVTGAVSFFDRANIAMYPTLGIVDRHGRLLDLQGSWTLHPAGRKLEADDVARWVATYARTNTRDTGN